MTTIKNDEVKEAKKVTPRKLTDDTEVTVVSNCKGILFYKSTSNVTKEWGAQADEQDMTIKELKEMKAQQLAFFRENWIIFPENQQDVIKHLKVEKHYTNVLFPEDIDSLFDKSYEEFASVLDNATAGVQSLIVGKAREKYDAKELTNTHIISLIQDKLNVDIDINKPR